MAQSKTKARVISREVIKGLAAAGAISTVVIAPNAAVLIDKYLRHLNKRDARRTVSYLKYRKLIAVKTVNGQEQYRLTRSGHRVYENLLIDELAVAMPKRWDKKWRLVMFDIPVGYRRQRDELLHKLRVNNFYMLQQSAWIHPFDCEKFVGILIDTLGLSAFVTFMVVEEGNFVEHATEHFKMSNMLM